MKCVHGLLIHSLVEFKNGKKHIAVECKECGKHMGFAKQHGVDLALLETKPTRREINEELGIPPGCRGCLDAKAGPKGFCGPCFKKGLHKKIKPHLKILGKTIWQLDMDDLFEIWSRPEMKAALLGKK